VFDCGLNDRGFDLRKEQAFFSVASASRLGPSRLSSAAVKDKQELYLLSAKAEPGCVAVQIYCIFCRLNVIHVYSNTENHAKLK
jgi:hypothetical protein